MKPNPKPCQCHTCGKTMSSGVWVSGRTYCYDHAMDKLKLLGATPEKKVDLSKTITESKESL